MSTTYQIGIRMALAADSRLLSIVKSTIGNRQFL
jgi:hypothetical protein